MALPGSLPLALSQIKTEFGGASTLFNYHRGGGYVPNHSANSSITTGSAAIAISNFLGSERYFTCSMSVGGSAAGGLVGYGGGIGSISRGGIGVSPSTLDQASFNGLYDAYIDVGFGPIYASTIFLIGGNYTGSWWNTISWGAISLSRGSSAAPSGTISGSETYWNWSTGPYFPTSGTNTLSIV